MSEQVKPWTLSDADLKWLRSQRMAAGSVCGLCGGTGRVSERVTCRECNKTGVVAYAPPAPEDTNDAA
jgi:hypothetical protein